MTKRNNGGRPPAARAGATGGGKPPFGPRSSGSAKTSGGPRHPGGAPTGAKPVSGKPVSGKLGPRGQAARGDAARSAGARRPEFADSSPEKARRPPREAGLWLYGHHPVLAALENEARRCHRLVTAVESADELSPALQRAIEARDIPVESVTRDVLERMLPAGSVHQGLALKVDPLEELSLDEACARDDGERAVVVVLDQVTDPHNVGAILRSAAAFGARAVIVTDRHAPGATAVMAKSASGALDVIPLVRVVNLARALDELGEMGYWRIALDADAEHSLAECDTTGSVAIVLGAEGVGLRRLTRERCDTTAKLPIKGMESLNVSNAAAVALYELVRNT